MFWSISETMEVQSVIFILVGPGPDVSVFFPFLENCVLVQCKQFFTLS